MRESCFEVVAASVRAAEDAPGSRMREFLADARLPSPFQFDAADVAARTVERSMILAAQRLANA